ASPGSNVNSKILLCVQKVAQEPILENINFVDVVSTPCVGRFVANVPDLNRRVLHDLALVSKIPLVHVRGAQIWIGRPQTAGIICQKVVSIADWHFKSGEVQRHATWSKLAQNLICIWCNTAKRRSIRGL